MAKLRLIIRYAFIGMAVLLLMGGCALIDEFLGEKEEKGPSELMSEGMRNLDRGNYEDAIEAFQQIRDRYPYSRFAPEAEMKIADTFYLRKEFDEAFDAYDDFEKLHPKNKDLPYVIYQKGMCHLRRVSTRDRDQSHTLKAKEEFERLVRRFPRDDYANRARKSIRRCLISLAEYELYVGHYYFKMGKYRAAIDRYSYIIKNYPDLGHYNEALEYIRICKEKLMEEQK